MPGRKLMRIAWPAFLAACLLQLVVFALVDPLELQWAGQGLGWSRQAVHAAGLFVFWGACMLASGLTLLLASDEGPEPSPVRPGSAG
ncbi:MAG TPA: hypothetical protein VFE82_17370 [Ramlibacter sp.]|jgi:hypothetical protein|uniref:hypothetical protein n=1 Tax=Ramlibacter sp. TaxID=1917967 RepID=UPI002D31876B|nr:hypothetical protein [Ramlibacter sp.]HZY20244.1 hypothetical protein [Ramlibacter sp.]